MNELRTPTNARFITWMVVAFVVVIADQVTKWAIIEWVALYEKVPVNSFVNLTHQRNTGAAFSFLADAGGWQRWFFIVLASVVSLMLLVWLLRLPRREWVTALGLALVLGGAIGNLIDRVQLGYVVDFVDVHYAGWHYPAFNVADSAITCGVILLLLDTFLLAMKRKKAEDG